MLRYVRCLLLAGCLSVCGAFSARAQTQSTPPAPPAASNDAAAAIKTKLDQAVEKTDLTADKTPPYRFHAKVTFHGKLTPFAPAEYTVLWADPNHWRAETRWPDLTAIEVASGDRIWKQDTDVRRMALNELHWALDFPRVLKTDEAKLSGPQPKTLNGIEADCFKMTRTFKIPAFSAVDPVFTSVNFPQSSNFTAVRDVCLLFANGLPLRIKEGSTEYDFSPGEYHVLGMKRFPGRVKHSYSNGSIEIEVDALEPLDQASAETIKPPSGAASLPWCRNEKPPRLIAPWGILSIHGVDKAFLEVANDGKVKGVRAVDMHGSPITDKSRLDALSALTFYPAICGDKVVEAEAFFSFPR